MWWKGLSLFEFQRNSMETEITKWSEFPTGEKATAEQILESEEINKSKRAGQWKSLSRIRVGKLTIWVRTFETEQLQLSLSDLSGLPEQASQSLWWMLNSPKRNVLAARLIERTTSMSDRRDSYGWVLVYNNGQNIWDKL